MRPHGRRHGPCGRRGRADRPGPCAKARGFSMAPVVGVALLVEDAGPVLVGADHGADAVPYADGGDGGGDGGNDGSGGADDGGVDHGRGFMRLLQSYVDNMIFGRQVKENAGAEKFRAARAAVGCRWLGGARGRNGGPRTGTGSSGFLRRFGGAGARPVGVAGAAPIHAAVFGGAFGAAAMAGAAARQLPAFRRYAAPAMQAQGGWRRRHAIGGAGGCGGWSARAPCAR